MDDKTPEPRLRLASSRQALRVCAETMELPLRGGELLHRPPGWAPALDGDLAAWIADHLGPVAVVGDGRDVRLRMSPTDYVAFVLR